MRAQAPEPVAITPALVDAAKKEAKVIFYSSMDLPVGEKLGKAFEAAYHGISVQIERSGSERPVTVRALGPRCGDEVGECAQVVEREDRI